MGKWSGSYKDGVRPTDWSSSADILHRWVSSNCNPVRYGQCWVFASVLCTGTLNDCDTKAHLGHFSVIELSPNAELLPSISLNFNWYIVRSRHAAFHGLSSSVREPIPWLIKGMDGLFHYPGPSNIQGWHVFFSSFFFPQWWGCWGFPPGWWQFLTQPTTLTATRQLKNITRVQERSSTSPRTAFGWCLLHSKTVKPLLYLLLNCILQ